MSSLHLNINLSFEQLKEVVKQLSPTDRLKLSDIIWNEEIEIPTEHQEMVLNRIKNSQTNPSRMQDWDTASKSLKS